LLRGLDAATPPPDLSERLSERGLQERERIVAHAETLVSLGILTPKQLEVAKRDIWRELGSRALLDSELAARIRLSPQQREEIAARLARTRRIQEESDATIGALRARTFEDGGRIALEADREIRRRTDEADSLVWDVLDESQLARLEAILHSKVNPPRPRR